MVIDSCAFIGHYPFRKTNMQSAKDLIHLMDQNSISKAVVSFIAGVYYRDMMDGNLELFEQAAPYADRLIYAANINPDYPCAMEDLERCVLEFGCREIRLWPKQTKSDPCGEAYQTIMRRCAQLNVPVAFCLEDTRGRHPLDISSTLTAKELAQIAQAVPEVDIVVHNPTSYNHIEQAVLVARTGKIYYDLGKLDIIYKDSLQNAVEALGFDRLLFGTGAPLLYADPQFVKLWALKEKLKVRDSDMEKIYSANAKTLYRL